MAYEGPTMKLTGLTASADLSSKQFHFVKISGANTVTVCAAVTDRPIGVLQNKPTSGQEAEIVACGVTKLSSDEAVAAGSVLGSSADGQAQVVTVGSETTVYIAGQALTASTAAGGIITAAVSCLAPARAA